MNVLYGPKESDSILEDLECQIVEFWFYILNYGKPLKGFWEEYFV